jgi:type I restriction enzyme S subunit
MEVAEQKKLKVPKLRFREFEDGWLKETAGDLCDFIVPGRNKPKSFEGSIPWVTTPDITHNGHISSSKSGLAITREEAKSVGSKIVPANAVVISCVGDLGLVAIAKNELVINQQLHAFIAKARIDYRFLMYIISTQHRYMERVATKTAVPYMNKENCNSIPIHFPTLPEQQKIAGFLSAVDEKLKHLNRKKELLQQYKKGVMQQLFSQELRFKREDGSDYEDWERVILGEVLDYEQPTKYLVSSTEYNDSYPTPVLTAGKTFILGYTDEQEGIFEDNLPVIIFDDFTTAYKYVDFPFKAKSSAMKMLFPKDKSFNIRFIYEFMSQIEFPIGEHKRYWISEYQHMEIPWPSLEEQQKIASFLSSLDEKIDAVSAQIELTQQFKKGLLQEMFV